MIRRNIEKLGKVTSEFIEEFGYGLVIFYESLYWLLLGRFNKQSVSMPLIASQAMQIGVSALPIVSILCFSVGRAARLPKLMTVSKHLEQR